MFDRLVSAEYRTDMRPSDASERQAMCAVIAFPAARAGRRSEASAAAEVIIFPGVRIERQDFSLADRLQPAPRPGAGQAKERETV
jgi:hypothetical protein